MSTDTTTAPASGGGGANAPTLLRLATAGSVDDG